MRVVLMLALPLAVAACEQAKAPPPPTAPTAAAAAAAAAAATAPKLAKIVFLDQETACDCTRQRIDGTWAALQAALGQPASLQVERIHVDTQAAQAETYTLLKPLMVVPGVYFVDDRNGVLEMLQGEVKQEQIAAVLKGR